MSQDPYMNEQEAGWLVKLYEQSIKNVPFLRYSWIIIATICILSLAAYFKLENSDVFFYAFGVLLVSFFGFLFSYLRRKTNDKFIRVLLNLLITFIVITLGIAIIGFGTFIIWEKPVFYIRWFPSVKDTSPIVPPADLTKVYDWNKANNYLNISHYPFMSSSEGYSATNKEKLLLHLNSLNQFKLNGLNKSIEILISIVKNKQTNNRDKTYNLDISDDIRNKLDSIDNKIKFEAIRNSK